MRMKWEKRENLNRRVTFSFPYQPLHINIHLSKNLFGKVLRLFHPSNSICSIDWYSLAWLSFKLTHFFRRLLNKCDSLIVGISSDTIFLKISFNVFPSKALRRVMISNKVQPRDLLKKVKKYNFGPKIV